MKLENKYNIHVDFGIICHVIFVHNSASLPCFVSAFNLPIKCPRKSCPRYDHHVTVYTLPHCHITMYVFVSVRVLMADRNYGWGGG